jgi:hypothetical protein
MSDEVFVRTKSHRARHKLDALLGYHPPYYWTWEDGGEFAKIPADKLDEARKIKGITKARKKPEDLCACWTN